MNQKIIWAFIGGLLVLTCFAIFSLGEWYGVKNSIIEKGKIEDRKIETENDIISSSSTNDNARQDSISKLELNYRETKNRNQNQKEKSSVKNWKTFINKNQGYKISYPDDTSVAQMGASGHEKDQDPTDGACITIQLKGGYVTVLGKTHTNDIETDCLRSGTGSDWGPAPDISAKIFGKKYIISGMETSSASAGYQKEFYYVDIPTGEKIEFGIEVNEKYAKINYLEAKDEVLEVLSSLEHL